MEVSQPQRQNANKVLLVLILVLITIFITFTFVSKGKVFDSLNLFSKGNNASVKSLTKFKIPENVIADYVTYKDKILQITNKGIDVLDTSNKLQYTISLQLQNPIIKTSDKYIFIADNNSKTIYCYDGPRVVWKKGIDSAISNIKVNKNGYILVLKQSSPNGEILGFNNKGTEILRKSYDNQLYLINADISNDNKKIATISAYTEKSRIASKLEIFDLKSTSQVNSIPVSAVLKDDTVASDVKLFNNGNIVLVTDTKLIGLDGIGKDKWEKAFNSSKIFNTNISSGSYAIIESNGSLKSSLLENKSRFLDILDQDGAVQGTQMKLEPIKNIDAFENFFLANTNSKVYCISKGKILWSYSPGKDIKYIKGFSEKSQVLFATKDSIEVFEIN